MTNTPTQSALETEVLRCIDSGYTVERQTDTSAVVVSGHRPNHLLHLILTVLTLGLWAIVWICIAIFGGERRFLLTVQADGAIKKTKAPKL